MFNPNEAKAICGVVFLINGHLAAYSFCSLGEHVIGCLITINGALFPIIPAIRGCAIGGLLTKKRGWFGRYYVLLISKVNVVLCLAQDFFRDYGAARYVSRFHTAALCGKKRCGVFGDLHAIISDCFVAVRFGLYFIVCITKSFRSFCSPIKKPF